MSFRSDISVEWASSPRIITVAAPSTTVDLQDLIDTVRTIEAYLGSLDDKKLMDAVGKQQLGPGLLVGLTVTLRNALLAFAARPAPTYVFCSVSGGNLVAVDAVGAPLASPLQPTAYVYVTLTQSTSAALISGTGGLTKADVDAAVWVESATGAQVVADAEQGAIRAAEASAHAAVAETQATLARKARTNRDELTEAASNNYTLYDDDGIAPLLTRTVTDKNGGPINLPVGVPAKRSAGI